MKIEIILFTSAEDIKNHRLEICDKYSFLDKFTTKPVWGFCRHQRGKRNGDEQNQGAIEW